MLILLQSVNRGGERDEVGKTGEEERRNKKEGKRLFLVEDKPQL